MVDYRQGIVSITIAILFTFFVFASVQAVKPQPSYNDFCDVYDFPQRQNLSEEEFEQQRQEFDERHRACQSAYDSARDEYRLFVFLVSAVISLLAIFVALKLPSKDEVMTMISSGLLLGGLISLFVGTIWGWQGIHIYARPLVLLFELVLVIFLAYKALSKKKKK